MNFVHLDQFLKLIKNLEAVKIPKHLGIISQEQYIRSCPLAQPAEECTEKLERNLFAEARVLKTPTDAVR